MGDASFSTDIETFRVELAELIIDVLVLDDVTVDEIDPHAPLFGDGLGLDSIDVLEIAFAVAQKYGFKLRSDDENNDKIFASLDALARHVAANRTK